MSNHELRTECVALQFDRPASDVLCVTIAGLLEASITPMFIAMLDELLRGMSEPCTIFWDVEALDHCDSTVRIEATRVLLRHRRRIRYHAILAVNPLVRMSSHFGAFVLGNVSVYRSRALFEAALEAAFGADLRECA